ncbi:MAG: transcription termination/antitermination NusG family protein, partial [Phycisphaerales bacterium]
MNTSSQPHAGDQTRSAPVEDHTDPQDNTTPPPSEGAPAAGESAPSSPAPGTGTSATPAGDNDSVIEGMIGADEPLAQEGMQWFVLRVASNKENSVQNTLMRKIQIENMTHLVGRILVPTEKIKTIKGGKAKIKEEKLYAGYVFVEMKLEDDGRIPQDIFFLIKETTGVGDFNRTTRPPPP